MIVAMVNQEDLNRAKIEASARLNLAAWDPLAGSIGLGWNKRRWKSWPWAPYGIGSRVNALVPWRDVASNSLPFGTCLVFSSIKDFPEFRGRAYVADAFGRAQPDDRLDLFFGRSAEKFRRSVRCLVSKPWSGVDTAPALGTQQALNMLGYVGANGKSLSEDGITGFNTLHALGTWAAFSRHWFQWGFPPRIRPEDPEVYYLLRLDAEQQS
jgi:hypothetical protein